MADKSVGELIAAQSVTPTDLFVLEQNGTAKKLTGQILENWLVSFADGHGGIQSIVKIETNVLADTYRITLADTTTFDFVVTNGRGVNSITKKSTSGLVDTYTITYNDGTTGTFTVTNGAKGDQGDNAYIWVKYASQEPTESSHSIGDIPDDWIGIYSGNASTAPTDWKQYKWFKHKGEKGDTGSPATLVTKSVTYQVGDSGTIIPSGSWGSSIPVVSQGKYLWTKTELRFNTGDPIVSYSVARMGIDGTGSVSSVAGVSPDATGNVTLTAADVGALAVSGGDMEGPINMNGHPISGLNDPTQDTEAATKGYVDTAKNEAVSYTNTQVKKAAPRNLLDNSDFRNPVNQRNGYFVPVGTMRYSDTGLTTERTAVSDTSKRTAYPVNSDYGYVYSGDTKFYVRAEDIHAGYSEIGYTIDRWLYGKATADGKNLLINAGSITIESGWIYQFIEGLDTTKKYTLVWCDDTGYKFVNNSPIRTDISSYPAVVINNTSGKNLIWAALYEGEYTADTLPEYQPKGYGAELAECQRYFYKITDASGTGLMYTSTGHVSLYIPYPVTMRATPTVTILRAQVWMAFNGENIVTYKDLQISHVDANEHALNRVLISNTGDFTGLGVVATVSMDDFSFEVSADL